MVRTDNMASYWIRDNVTWVQGFPGSGRNLFDGVCLWTKKNPETVKSWILQPKSLAHAQGGALHLGNSEVVVTSTRFEENCAQDGELRSLGGAIFINDGSSLRAEGCSFTRNRVTAIGKVGAGGAIRVDVGGTLWLQNTLHEANVVKSESEANGGAISSAGIVTLAAGNAFRANSVSGMGRSTGGAIAVGGQGSTLVAMDGAQFVDNTVTRLSQAAKLPLRLHTCLTIWVQFRLPALGWGAVCVLGWTDL
jgi:hypothetical protein